MKQGDLVIRKSYGGDVIFKIEQFNGQVALLRGIDVRLLADAPVTDLISAPGILIHEQEHDWQARVSESMRQIGQFRTLQLEKSHIPGPGRSRSAASYFEVPGKVLHLDGDPVYLRKSMQLYGQLRVPAEGYFVQEANMAEALQRLLPQVKPDVVVLTGHDGILKHRKDSDIYSLDSYKNSYNFVNAVKVARQYERDKDSLVVVAGACQSHFEALLQSGANFASSPARVLIHALDPLHIAAKVSFTSIKDTVHIMDVIHHTMSGLEGLGGIETRGSFRLGIPRPMGNKSG